MAAAVGLCIVVAYLLLGRAVANHLAPAMADRARDVWYSEENVRNSFYFRYAATVALWPLRLVGLSFTRNADGVSLFDRYDAVRVERRDREQRDRIALLERELGVRSEDGWSA